MEANDEQWLLPEGRLAWARKEASFDTPTEAAQAMRANSTTYLGHENGSRGLQRAAPRYAQFFRVSLAWLLTGSGVPKGKNPAAELYEHLPPEKQRQALEYLVFLRDRP